MEETIQKRNMHALSIDRSVGLSVCLSIYKKGTLIGCSFEPFNANNLDVLQTTRPLEAGQISNIIFHKEKMLPSVSTMCNLTDKVNSDLLEDVYSCLKVFEKAVLIE
ncbi:hypothetical protein GOODEAATRI_025043 [Goodea atripinnis]|uniref:Uncharacterized protein n=1 Tax=Goodea atripinnis TaxID=208336 RepID=A0ABV0N452_9TELE